MKSILKNWAVTNLMELSTWVGIVMLTREMLAYNASNLMVMLALVLIFVSDAKLNGYIQKVFPEFKKWIESL